MEAQTKKRIKIVGVILFLIYISFLLFLLFFYEGYSRNIVWEDYRYNFIPLKEIIRFWNYREQLGIGVFTLNVLGNIVAFIPLGLFLPIISIRLRKAWKVILIGALLSTVVEFLQLVTKVGCCDIDDLILNIFGTIIGFGLFCICNVIYRKRHWLTQ